MDQEHYHCGTCKHGVLSDTCKDCHDQMRHYVYRRLTDEERRALTLRNRHEAKHDIRRD